MITIRPTSVIVCTHNRANLLPRVIDQLRSQDYPADAFEIIVVDNRSSDDTRQVVERLTVEPGVPIYYLYESRPGITYARNRGAEKAYYPYLAYIDDDCSVSLDWMQHLLGGFDLDKRVVAVGGQVLPQWDRQKRPLWLGHELERWLASNGYLGTRPKLLENGEHIVEGNMALERRAWQEAGGFIGMEQFGSKNMAAGEVLYLLEKLRGQGGKIAFVPQAMAYHHISKLLTRQWMVQRAYWQGVSDALLEHLLYRRPYVSVAYRAGLNMVALLVLLMYAGVSYLKLDNRKGMFHSARAIRRVGLLLGEMRLVGNWHRVRSWLSEHNPSQ